MKTPSPMTRLDLSSSTTEAFARPRWEVQELTELVHSVLDKDQVSFNFHRLLDVDDAVRDARRRTVLTPQGAVLMDEIELRLPATPRAYAEWAIEVYEHPDTTITDCLMADWVIAQRMPHAVFYLLDLGLTGSLLGVFVDSLCRRSGILLGTSPVRWMVVQQVEITCPFSALPGVMSFVLNNPKKGDGAPIYTRKRPKGQSPFWQSDVSVLHESFRVYSLSASPQKLMDTLKALCAFLGLPLITPEAVMGSPMPLPLAEAHQVINYWRDSGYLIRRPRYHNYDIFDALCRLTAAREDPNGCYANDAANLDHCPLPYQG